MLIDELEPAIVPYMGKDKTIAVFTSGGLDSTILLAVCIHLRAKHGLECDIETYTVPQGYDQKWSQRVVAWIEEHYQVRINQHIIGDPDLPPDQRVVDALRASKEFCDHAFLGDTTNPVDLPPGPARPRSQSTRYIQPFYHWTKDRVLRLGLEMGLQDLIQLTTSCNNDNDCGQCWACQERQWAFRMVAEAGFEPATHGL